MPSASPISGFDQPAATRRRTSSSRAVRPRASAALAALGASAVPSPAAAVEVAAADEAATGSIRRRWASCRSDAASGPAPRRSATAKAALTGPIAPARSPVSAAAAAWRKRAYASGSGRPTAAQASAASSQRGRVGSALQPRLLGPQEGDDRRGPGIHLSRRVGLDLEVAGREPAAGPLDEPHRPACRRSRPTRPSRVARRALGHVRLDPHARSRRPTRAPDPAAGRRSGSGGPRRRRPALRASSPAQAAASTLASSRSARWSVPGSDRAIWPGPRRETSGPRWRVPGRHRAGSAGSAGTGEPTGSAGRRGRQR